MSLTGAERQRRYKERHSNLMRLDVLVEPVVLLRLARLARHYKVPQREILAVALDELEMRVLRQPSVQGYFDE